MDDSERAALGMATRRAALGDAYVDQAVAGTTALTEEFQSLVNRYCWGEIWTRPGLDTATRRLLAMGMVIALNREAEFRTHVRAALTDGLSLQLIKEVVLQSAVYCGIPAAGAAFAAVQAIASELAIDH